MFKSEIMPDTYYKILHNQLSDGIEMKIIHREHDLIMTELNIQKGIRVPEHVHQSDHSAYLVKGRIQVIADGIISVFVTGDSWCMGKGIAHTTEAIDDSVVLEVYNPED
jgi:quercetin dioxygenase-like cupin family protein